MSLSCLALQAVLLILVVDMVMEALPGIDSMSLRSILMFLDLAFVHVVEDANAELNISDKRITAGLGEVLTDNYTKHLHVIGVGCHGVSCHNPRALT